MAGLALVVFKNTSHMSAMINRELGEKTKFMIHRSWRVHGMPGAPQGGPGELEERLRSVRTCTWGSALLEVEGGVATILQAHSSLVYLKPNSRN